MKRRGGVFTTRGWLVIGFILCAIAGAAFGIVRYARAGSSTVRESEAVPAGDHIPEWIGETSPEDVFWGIGTARMENESLALQVAAAEARRDIAEQLSVLLQRMFIDYAPAEEPLSRERLTGEIIDTGLFGAVINARKRMPDGTWWVRVSLQRAEAVKAVSHIIESEAARFAGIKAQEALKMLDAEQ